MIIRWGLLKKTPGLDDAGFRAMWKDPHGPITLQCATLRHYFQNVVVEARQRGSELPRGPVEVDGLSELWFDNLYDMESGLTPPIRSELAQDAARFLSDVKVISTVRNAALPDPVRAGQVRRLSFLTRRNGLDVQTFQEIWWRAHAEKVRALPGLLGYSQYLVIDRQVGGASVPWKDLPVDGIAVLDFESKDSMDHALASAAAEEVRRHAREFASQANNFLVDRVTVKA